MALTWTSLGAGTRIAGRLATDGRFRAAERHHPGARYTHRGTIQRFRLVCGNDHSTIVSQRDEVFPCEAAMSHNNDYDGSPAKLAAKPGKPEVSFRFGMDGDRLLLLRASNGPDL